MLVWKWKKIQTLSLPTTWLIEFFCKDSNGMIANIFLKVCFMYTRKRKILIPLFFLIVVLVMLLVFLKLEDRVPEGVSGRMAYVKNKSLVIRDYDTRKDTKLGKLDNPVQLLWSPLGKYILAKDRGGYIIFDVLDNKQLKSPECDFFPGSEIKWIGKKDELVARYNETFQVCDFKTRHKSVNLSGLGSILDWVPLNEDILIVLTRDSVGLNHILRYGLTDNSVLEIVKENGQITLSNNKYLWFAEDRNFVYTTSGYIHRLLLTKDFQTLYKNSVKVEGDIQLLGWNQSICVEAGRFNPLNEFFILNNGKVKQINFTAPAIYYTSSKQAVLEKNETYWHLAERIFGDGSRWKELYKYNTNIEPTQLQVGLAVNIPLEEILEVPDSKLSSNTIFIPWLINSSDTDQLSPFIYGIFEKKAVEKYGPDISFSARSTLQNDPIAFFVSDGSSIMVYKSVDKLVDIIKGANIAVWDWSLGYCYNHKNGGVIPSGEDPTPLTRYCADFLEIPQYKIHLLFVCEENWNETIRDAQTILENSLLGIKLIIHRFNAEKIPQDAEKVLWNGVRYSEKEYADNRYEYSFYPQMGLNNPIVGINIVCTEQGLGKCTDIIVENLGWTTD